MTDETPRLVKTIFIFSNGNTVEKNYVANGRKCAIIGDVARLDGNVVREYPHHYQVFLRVEKCNDQTLLAEEIFRSAVNTLSKMLLLKRKKD